MVAVCTMVRLILNGCCLYNGKTYMCLQSDKYVLPKNCIIYAPDCEK